LDFRSPALLPARLRRRKPRLGGFRCRLGLGQLLGTVEALVAQLARALQTGPGLGQARLGFGDAGACLGKFASTVSGAMRASDLPARDDIADAGADFDNAMVGDLRPDDGLLPGGDVAAGGEGLRPVEGLRLDSVTLSAGLAAAGALDSSGVSPQAASNNPRMIGRGPRHVCSFATARPFRARSRWVRR
jgi:hypothetical protein